MEGLYLIPGFRKQIEEIANGFFRVGETGEPEVSRHEDCTNKTYTLTINGCKARLEEKRSDGVHWLEYRGTIPNKRRPGTLTFFGRRLKAYESDGSWIRTDSHDHVVFP